MPDPAFRELPLGRVRPQGWLRDQLRLQADGITGQLGDIWPDVGPENGWLGGPGDNWERGPYYADGLVPLAHVLGDADLIAKADRWVEGMLASQRDDGQFGPAGNDDWWPRMVALKVLAQHADATGDPRVSALMERYFRYQLVTLPERPLQGWGRARGADNALTVMWLHRQRGWAWLEQLASLLLAQTDSWAQFLAKELPAGPAPSFRHLIHGVNVAMGLKTPAIQFLCDGDDAHRDEVEAMWARLDELHGLVHGTFSGDEWLGGRGPHHGVETCLVVELMFTLEQLAGVFGDGRYGDQLEQVGFNLLPASSDPRMLAHQYHQQANQVLVSFAPRDWSFSGPDANVFGLVPHFGCCTANLHQGWPKLVRSLWMQAGPRSLAAVAYAPCTVNATLDGIDVQLDVVTEYPFGETISIRVGVDAPATFDLRLRVPAWCQSPTVAAGSDTHPAVADGDGYVTVGRTWRDGDTVSLTFPMEPRLVPRDRGAVGVRLGPLVLAHAVREIWRAVPDAEGLGEWEITPRSWWNVGVDTADPDAWRIERRPVGPIPWRAEDTPVVVHAPGVPLPQWTMVDNSAGPPPTGPVSTPWPIVDMPLVPYGSARLRIAELPTVAPTAPD